MDRPQATALTVARRDALRRLTRWTLSVPAVSALAACGFELRKAPELHFQTLALQGFRGDSNIANIVRQQVNATTTTRVVEGIAQAQVVLQCFVDNSERVVVASTAAGQVRELTLRSRLIFRVKTADDTDLIPRTQLLLTRDLTFTEEAALGKEQEQAVLYRAMQNDIASQLVRRLGAIRLPT